MSAALLVSLLLLGSPVQSVQDSVSAQRVEKLENRISELEKQVLEYEAREDYFQSILRSQRWTFGTVVAVFSAFVVLISAVIGVISFGAFRRYVKKVEETKSEMEDRMEEELGKLSNGLEDVSGKVESLNEQVEGYEENLSSTEEELTRSVEETRNDCMEHTSLSVAEVETEIQVLRTAIMKLDDKVEGLTHYPEGEEE